MSETRLKAHPTLGILVSTDGHVMVPATKFSKAHWTLGTKHRTGYRCVTITYGRYLVHRLVAETFLDNSVGLPQVDHIAKRRSADKTEINTKRRARYAANPEYYRAKLNEYRRRKKGEKQC